MVSVLPSLLPTNVAMPCTLSRTVASHLKLIGPVIVKVERDLTNYEVPPCKKGKVAETKSTTKEESSKIYICMRALRESGKKASRDLNIMS